MGLNFDEINSINPKETAARSVPFEQYFGEMELTDEEKRERIEMAYQFNDLFVIVLALMTAQVQFNAIDYGYVRNRLEIGYIEIVTSRGIVNDAYIQQYAADFVDDFINTTVDNQDDSYYLSQDRAQFMAENESQTMNEYKEYVEAIKKGYKYKTWVTMNDPQVRKTHKKLEGKTIGIKSLFNVGSVQMRFPKDYSKAGSSNRALREIINCRCHAKYSK